jgi:hypothetical protein
LLAGLLTLHLTTTLAGVDYGKHWDEKHMQILLTNSVETLQGWPRKYFYGSVYLGLGQLALAPDWFAKLPELIGEARSAGSRARRLTQTPRIRKIQKSLIATIDSPSFLVRCRKVFAVVASASIVFLFFAGNRLSRTGWGGVLAASVLALSWEVNTHARHIAIDSTLVALVCLLLLFMIRHSQQATQESRRWLYACALVVGLATGTKFTAIVLLCPVLLLSASRLGDRNAWRITREAVTLTWVTLATTLAMNPGLLFDTAQVAADWGWAAHDYQRSTVPGLDPYRVEGSWRHFWQATTYLGTSALSPWRGIAFVLDACGVVGLVISMRRNRWLTISLASVGVIYLATVVQGGLMIPRNYLPVLPVWALFIMLGAESLTRSRKVARVALVFGAVWVGINAQHMIATAATVYDKPTFVETMVELKEYVSERPHLRFLAESSVLQLADQTGNSLRQQSNIIERKAAVDADYDHWIYTLRDFRGMAPEFRKHGYFTKVFGPQEVNYDYYPDWIGTNRMTRIFILERERASASMALQVSANH